MPPQSFLNITLHNLYSRWLSFEKTKPIMPNKISNSPFVYLVAGRPWQSSVLNTDACGVTLRFCMSYDSTYAGIPTDGEGNFLIIKPKFRIKLPHFPHCDFFLQIV
jgi:hypothetical protein